MKNIRIEALTEILKKAPDEVFIQPHNVPDPDAIASSYALQVLLKQFGITTVIVYEQVLSKANALRLVNSLNIEMKIPHEVETLGEEDWTVLVDVQKENANLTDLVTREVACIDHHNDNGFTDYLYKDVQENYGSCSALIENYWNEAGLIPPGDVATALIYGIRSDTDGLSRGVNIADIEAYYRLYPYADMSKITEFDSNTLKLSVLKNYASAFDTVEVYGKLGFIRLESEDDSLLGSAGDILLSVENVDMVVAYAVRKHGVKFSIRSIESAVSAASLVSCIVAGYGVGGGHDTMAGGFIPIESFPSDRSCDTFTRVKTIEFVENALSGSQGFRSLQPLSSLRAHRK